MTLKTLIIHRIFLSLLVVILYLASCFGQNNKFDSIVKKDAETYHLRIVHDSIVPTSWDSVSYSIAHKDSLYKYIFLLQKEIEKYPSDFFTKIGISKLVICADLVVKNFKRAAMPDSEKHQLFLSVYNSEKPYKDIYKCHVFHHELNHCTEYAVWKDYYKKWNKWNRLNQKPFKYGSGGEVAYKNRKINWRTVNNRTSGFINKYSTLGQEEDRSEIVAFIMTDIENDTIRKIIKDDRILYRKAEVLNKKYKKNFKYNDFFLEDRIK